MIFALEGPDCCGKTTLLGQLKELLPGALFIGPAPLPRELWPVMSFVEERQEWLWDALYDPARTIVCDRHVAVSGPVYDRLHGREERVPWQRWKARLHVVYLDLSLPHLRTRLAAFRKDDYFDNPMYERCVALYKQHIREFPHTVLPAEDCGLAAVVARTIRGYL